MSLKKIFIIAGLVLLLISPVLGSTEEAKYPQNVEDNNKSEVLADSSQTDNPADPGQAGMEEVAPKNRFSLGVGGGIFYVNQQNWADIYSKANFAFAGKLAYQIRGKYEIFAEMDFVKATGELIPTLDEIEFSATPFYFGANYLLKAKGMFTPYAGLGAVLGNMKETGSFGEIKENTFGFFAQLGTYVNFTDNLALDVVLKYDMQKFENLEYGAEADLSGARLLLLLTYKFN